MALTFGGECLSSVTLGGCPHLTPKAIMQFDLLIQDEIRSGLQAAPSNRRAVLFDADTRSRITCVGQNELR